MTTSSTHLSSPRTQSGRLRSGWSLRIAAALLLVMQTAVWAQAPTPSGAPTDPPGRVARLNVMEGAVSFAPADAAGSADASDWTPAVLNRPLTTSDRLWTGQRARSELHIGSTAVRMSEQTSLDFLTLDDNVTQLHLAQGSVKLRVRALPEGQRLEVNTPNLAFVISQPGDYRIDADPASNTTRVVAQAGSGVIYGDSGAPLNLGNQQQGSFTGTNLTPAAAGAGVQDGFDAWAVSRDRREDQSVSARYVPREIVGYQQLDNYGDWGQDPGYGAVWLPRAVPANWAPYRVGHWSWIAPWGWTWMDDAPWGFAPFHYGRWARIGPRWAWVPGRLGPRPVYAPALVAFIGGGNGGVNWNISIGSGGQAQPGVGWFPLAPGEAFRPAYRVSPRYVTQVNNSIVVNNTINVTKVYRYQRQVAAVTAVSASDFARGRPVRDGLQRLSAGDLSRSQVVTDGTPEHRALPKRVASLELPRPAPVVALPPAALQTARPVAGSRIERRDERMDENRDAGQDVKHAERPQDRNSKPLAQAPSPPPTLPAAKPGPSARAPVTVAPAAATIPAAASPVRQAPALQRDQERQQGGRTRQQDAQREQNPKASPERIQPAIATPADARPPAAPDARAAAAARGSAEQAQRATQRAQAQALRKVQSDQQRQQRDLAQPQAQKNQQNQQDQARQQRQAREQSQRQQQEQRTQQTEKQQPARGTDTAHTREPRVEGGPGRNQEQ